MIAYITSNSKIKIRYIFNSMNLINLSQAAKLNSVYSFIL